MTLGHDRSFVAPSISASPVVPEIAAFKAGGGTCRRLVAYWQPGWETSIVPTRQNPVEPDGDDRGGTGLSPCTSTRCRTYRSRPTCTRTAPGTYRTIPSFGAGTINEEENNDAGPDLRLRRNPKTGSPSASWKNRPDSDQIELHWLSRSIVESALPIKSIKAEHVPPHAGNLGGRWSAGGTLSFRPGQQVWAVTSGFARS